MADKHLTITVPIADLNKAIQQGWKDALKTYNIGYLTTREQVRVVATEEHTVCVSRCSPVKTDIKKGTPRQLYLNAQNIRFFEWCGHNNLKWGILSDKYGLFMSDERREAYDVHPSELTNEGFRRIGVRIHKTMKKRGFNRLLFYNPSPIMAAPYFKMMLFSEMPIYYMSRLWALKIKGFLQSFYNDE